MKREREERAGEREELARLRRRVEILEKEKGMMEEHIDFHIPLRNNEICDVPKFTRSLDETMECYHDPEGGVRCLHAHVHVEGRLKEMRFRRRIRMLKAKK